MVWRIPVATGLNCAGVGTDVAAGGQRTRDTKQCGICQPSADANTVVLDCSGVLAFGFDAGGDESHHGRPGLAPFLVDSAAGDLPADLHLGVRPPIPNHAGPDIRDDSDDIAADVSHRGGGRQRRQRLHLDIHHHPFADPVSRLAQRGH